VFLLNLTWLQFAALFGGVSAGVVALYLWDRTRRRLTVPTLRFWVASEQVSEVKHRRRIQQPLSLLLQLASIALLLLALGQLRVGARGASARDHVLILDTSAWMAARGPKGTLMDQARGTAKAYVESLPSGDRLMLVRADALATPATAFEGNKNALEQAIDQSQPGATALNLRQAFDFARQAQRLQSGRAGEVVYVGPGRISDSAADLEQHPVSNLRVLPVPEAIENCGLKKIGLRRSASDPDTWEILAGVHNYGTRPRTVTLALAFGGSPAGTRQLTIPPGTEQNVTFEYRSRAAGWLEARLFPPDDFPANDRAVLELPERRLLRVVVYSEEAELFRPVLAANPEVEAVLRKPAEYRAGEDAGIVILDRFSPPRPPAADSVWIQPPVERSPARMRSVEKNVLVARWRSDHPLAAGLRAKDLKLEETEVFHLAPEDVAIAEAEAGPVIVARGGRPKTIVLGFHPVRPPMRYELATPLLFANVLRWMAPDIFRRWELNAGSAGTVDVPLEPDSDGVSVRAQDGSALPFTQQAGSLRFFTAQPGTVRIAAGDRELVYSLTLPEMAETKWTPPKNARHGIPAPIPARLEYAELWPWLALAGALGLLAEWFLFGRRRFGLRVAGAAGEGAR
jgi:hypothetical protein